MNYLIAFIIGAVLWRAGGYSWKWARRFVLPFAITINNWVKKRKLTTLLLFPILSLAFSLGYGESKPYWYKFIVGCIWIAPRFIFIGFSWIALSVPIIWIVLFWLSNHKPWSNFFKWQLVEVVVGGTLGVAYV